MKLFDKIEYFTLYLMLDVAKKKKHANFQEMKLKHLRAVQMFLFVITAS